jgi:hypothetical protein
MCVTKYRGFDAPNMAWYENGGRTHKNPGSTTIVRGFHVTWGQVYEAEYHIKKQLILRDLWGIRFADYKGKQTTDPVYKYIRNKFAWLQDDTIPIFFREPPLYGWITQCCQDLSQKAEYLRSADGKHNLEAVVPKSLVHPLAQPARLSSRIRVWSTFGVPVGFSFSVSVTWPELPDSNVQMLVSGPESSLIVTRSIRLFWESCKPELSFAFDIDWQNDQWVLQYLLQ